MTVLILMSMVESSGTPELHTEEPLGHLIILITYSPYSPELPLYQCGFRYLNISASYLSCLLERINYNFTTKQGLRYDLARL